MSRGDQRDVPRAVLGMDVLARSFFDPQCLRVLQLWRDGQIRLLMTRPLLAQYIRILSRLNIPQELLRQWIWWFTTPEKVEVVEDLSSAVIITGEDIDSPRRTPAEVSGWIGDQA